jgi:hypothetical protein
VGHDPLPSLSFPTTYLANGKTAGAAVAALVSTGGSRLTSGMPKRSTAPHAAIGARDDTTTRPIDMAVMIRDLRQIVGSHQDNPLPTFLGHLYPPVVNAHLGAKWALSTKSLSRAPRATPPQQPPALGATDNRSVDVKLGSDRKAAIQR